MGTTAQHNHELDEYVARLCSRSYEALLLLLKGGSSTKEIAYKAGVLPSSVSRIRKRYERLSGTRLPRLRMLAAA